MALLIEHAQKLLDFNEKLDIILLDHVINAMYNGNNQQQKMSLEVLTRFKENPDSWTRVDTILEYSTNFQTKYFALQILENAIKIRWKALPKDQCDGLIIKISSNSDLAEKEKVYLGKLNLILVQILKKEWPHNWPTFISEIVGSSKTNESLCQNNMVILKLLSEEVFDFSSGQMTQNKIRHLKDQLCKEFMQIFHLCQSVMDDSNNAPLLLSTLETLLKFLSWIPLGYIFETKLITTLIHRFLMVPLFRNITLQCVTEIGGLKAPQYDEQFLNLYLLTIKQIKSLMPINTSNLAEVYAKGNDDEQNFIQNLSLFLATFFKEHGNLLENKVFSEELSLDSKNIVATMLDKKHEEYINGGNIEDYNTELGELGLVSIGGIKEAVLQGHYYLLLISRVEEIEIFKICLEYWNYLAASLYKEKPVSTNIFGSSILGTSFVTEISHNSLPPRWRLYNGILSKLRVIIVSRMARPEEVLVVENEQGEVVREFMKDTDAINLYKNMRETLVYLTHLDYGDTERIMLEKLEKQVNGEEWSWKNINSLCWAIGSISGAMCEDDEKRFLVTIIKDLLYLCEQKRGKDNKAIVASDIMYVVGQYPRFLKAHWKFLKTVVNKLFEFMHETHEGVQDMACDTFIKIALKCRRHFIQVQTGEIQPFVEEILSNINNIICDLSSQQVHVFYEAIGMMIASASSINSLNNPSTIANPFGGGLSSMTINNQEILIQKYMSLPNQAWEDIVEEASKNVEILKDPNIIKQLGSILKTNIKACKALEQSYVSQLAKIYLDMLNLYQVMNNNLIQIYSTSGSDIDKQPLVQGMKSIKRDILRLISSWISYSTDHKLVLDNFVSPLLEAILPSYKNDPPEIKESEVLSTLTSIFTKLGGASTFYNLPGIDSLLHTSIFPVVMDSVFEPTLGMINANFTDWPEHRVNFYEFLKVIFGTVLSFVPEEVLSNSPTSNAMISVNGVESSKRNNHYIDELTAKEYQAILSFDVNAVGGGQRFKLIFDSVVWGIKHTMRNVAEISIDVLSMLLKNVESHYQSRTAQSFYLNYYTTIIEHMFAVVSDTSLTADLPNQSTILAHLFGLPELGKITFNLNLYTNGAIASTLPLSFNATQEIISSNIEYTRQFVKKLLTTAFQHLTEYQLNIAIEGFLTLNHDMSAFKEHLRDFLVQIREYAGTDDSDLYLSEKEASIKKAYEEKIASISNIPGMIKPSEMPEDMQQ